MTGGGCERVSWKISSGCENTRAVSSTCNTGCTWIFGGSSSWRDFILTSSIIRTGLYRWTARFLDFWFLVIEAVKYSPLSHNSSTGWYVGGLFCCCCTELCGSEQAFGETPSLAADESFVVNSLTDSTDFGKFENRSSHDFGFHPRSNETGRCSNGRY